MTTTAAVSPDTDDLALAYGLRQALATIPDLPANRSLAEARHLAAVSGIPPEVLALAMGCGVDAWRSWLSGRRHPQDSDKFQRLLAILAMRATALGLPTEPPAGDEEQEQS